jgi:hypothetical protein
VNDQDAPLGDLASGRQATEGLPVYPVLHVPGQMLPADVAEQLLRKRPLLMAAPGVPMQAAA